LGGVHPMLNDRQEESKMKTTYINGGEYRIDEFENGKRFLLKKNGNYYEVVGEINRNSSKEDKK
jgi:hypothetical protein